MVLKQRKTAAVLTAAVLTGRQQADTFYAENAISGINDFTDLRLRRKLGEEK